MLHMTAMVILTSMLLLVVQGVGQNLISPEQAKEAVRAFEGDPSLEFKTVKLETDTMLLPEVWYELEANNGRAWVVDAKTGEVTWAYYPEAIPHIRTEEPFGPLTKEECYKIAENFARAKYVGFDNMNFKLFDERWTGQGWEFQWDQKLDYEAIGCNFVRIEINPANGRIQVYQALRVEQQPLKQPKIIEEQAINIAKQTLKLKTVYRSESILTATPDGRVIWEVAIRGEIESGDYKGGIVYIDAETGEVLDLVFEAGEFSQGYWAGGKGSAPKIMIYGKWGVMLIVLLGGTILLGLWLKHLFSLKLSST